MSKTANTTGKVTQWGNSLALRIPQAIAKAANLGEGRPVHLAVEGGVLTVTALGELRLTLAERLARFDPARHAGAWYPGAYES